jgi:hypothetical protein
MKAVRIKDAPKDGIRTELCIEDLHIPRINDLIELGLLSVLEVLGEKVYFFKEPVDVPLFDVFYASPVKDVNDRYLTEAFRRLLYLNPNPSVHTVKLLIVTVLTRFVAKKKVESELLQGQDKVVPVLTYEEVRPICNAVIMMNEDYTPNSDRLVFFGKDSKLTTKQKTSLSLQARQAIIKGTTELLIHQKAEYLNETDQLLFITKKRIADSSKDLTLHKTNAHISPRTSSYIEDANMNKFFKTEKSKVKFEKYLELREEGFDKKQACKLIGVSDTTKVEFARVEERINN